MSSVFLASWPRSLLCRQSVLQFLLRSSLPFLLVPKLRRVPVQHGRATLIPSSGFHYRAIALPLLDLYLLLKLELFLTFRDRIGLSYLQQICLMLVTPSELSRQPLTTPWVLKAKVFRGRGEIDLILVVCRGRFYK